MRLEALDRLARHDLVQRLLDELGRQHFRPQRRQVAVQAHARRIAGNEVQIRAVPLEDLFQKCIDLRHALQLTQRRRGWSSGQRLRACGDPACGSMLRVGDELLEQPLFGRVAEGLVGIDLARLIAVSSAWSNICMPKSLPGLQLRWDLVRLVGRDQLARSPWSSP